MDLVGRVCMYVYMRLPRCIRPYLPRYICKVIHDRFVRLYVTVDLQKCLGLAHGQ